jgi:large subunit ribosomal protein L24
MERLRVGDQVVVISGKHKGQAGRLAKILRDRDMVVVEGVNVVTRHEKPSPRSPQGGLVKREAPLFACKVMPVDPETGKPTRVRVGEVEGKRVRKAKSGAVLATEK